MGADITAAVILISMGALLGRTTPVQLLVMGLVEVVAFAANEHFQLELLMVSLISANREQWTFFCTVFARVFPRKVADIGGSITVHAFGAYFGLAVSLMLQPKPSDGSAGTLEGSSYHSDIFAMIGTLFLWIFWPSFNSALISDVGQQHRAILNTYLSLAAATGIAKAFHTQTEFSFRRFRRFGCSHDVRPVDCREPRPKAGHGARSEFDARRRCGHRLHLQHAHRASHRPADRVRVRRCFSARVSLFNGKNCVKFVKILIDYF